MCREVYPILLVAFKGIDSQESRWGNIAIGTGTQKSSLKVDYLVLQARSKKFEFLIQIFPRNRSHIQKY